MPYPIVNEDGNGEHGWLKCNCRRCGGGIEFLEHGVGTVIACPHCGETITLCDESSYKTGLKGLREWEKKLRQLKKESENKQAHPPISTKKFTQVIPADVLDGLARSLGCLGALGVCFLCLVLIGLLIGQIERLFGIEPKEYPYPPTAAQIEREQQIKEGLKASGYENLSPHDEALLKEIAKESMKSDK